MSTSVEVVVRLWDLGSKARGIGSSVYLYSQYSSREKLGSPLTLMTGMTETGLETAFMDLLLFTGRAGLSAPPPSL